MEHTFVIPPGEYTPLPDEASQIEKCQEWGLLSEKAVKLKEFVYKGGGRQLSCTVVGYIDAMTAVVEFENGERHCIHPSYLKEMQAASFSQRIGAADPAARVESADESTPATAAAEPAAAASVTPVSDRDEPAEEPVPRKEPAKKEKKTKLKLPEEKVKLTAVVKEFVSVPNHFTEEDDEVVVYEQVRMVEPELDIGDAWSSHSNTLKKLELAEGDVLAFEAKIIAKKLTRHPVPYKINNPSKIQKQ
ncbi:hypothetical protein PA598K_00370 [Paenibacillus sp. 598K]|uniref:hypothetical protein n=1 Tax=Paenibacillus sp. 598K TaxID=1117987 RepID=UPI000FFACBE4|nr:hypothetical protein [Paenibacillus sp. 598K]GBF72134.1 hypothetical protein PA598K_00370 [Paenibacillus sp. 598K]